MCAVTEDKALFRRLSPAPKIFVNFRDLRWWHRLGLLENLSLDQVLVCDLSSATEGDFFLSDL